MTQAPQVSECILHDTDPVFSAAVNRYGCRVFTLLAIPQFVVGRCLTAKDIKLIIADGERVPTVIRTDDRYTLRTGREEHILINDSFAKLLSNRKGRQVGWNDSHIITRPWEFMIAQWETDGPDGHFTLFDRGQKEIYDPHDPKQAGYEINKKRIIRRLIYRTWEART